MDALFMQLLGGHGWIHADPHSGNLGVDKAGRVVMYDYGSVVHVDQALQAAMRDLVVCIASNDSKGAVRVLQTKFVGDVDVQCSYAAESYVDTYFQYIKSLDVAALQKGIQANITTSNKGREGIRLSPRLIRLGRAFTLLEGVCLGVDSKWNYWEYGTRALPRLLLTTLLNQK